MARPAGVRAWADSAQLEQKQGRDRFPARVRALPESHLSACPSALTSRPLQWARRPGDAKDVIRLILIVVILAGGSLMLVDRVSLSVPELPTFLAVSLPSLSRNPLSPELSVDELVIESGDIEVRFARRGAFDSEHMVFGGLNTEPHNTLSNATLSVLDMTHARAISQSFPDFHRCDSRGAPQAKRRMHEVHIIGIDGRTRDSLHDVVDLHMKRVRESGARTCVALSGEQLVLTSVKLIETGRDVSAQTLSGFREAEFLLAKTVETPDCETLLAR